MSDEFRKFTVKLDGTNLVASVDSNKDGIPSLTLTSFIGEDVKEFQHFLENGKLEHIKLATDFTGGSLIVKAFTVEKTKPLFTVDINFLQQFQEFRDLLK